MTYQIADKRNPFMGLDNKICKNPTYWRRLYQVWLSEEDVRRKKCKCKADFDLIGTHRCGNLERKGGGNEKRFSDGGMLLYLPTQQKQF